MNIYLLIFGMVYSSGVLVHLEISQRALIIFEKLHPSISSIVSKNLDAFQAGSFFPDWGYICFNTNGSESAHWPPFYNKLIKDLKRDQTDYQLLAFIFGVVSHSVADILWHGLDGSQGFIGSLEEYNFKFRGISAHSTADLGGDFVVSRLSDFSYLQSNWKIPTLKILKAYQDLEVDVGKIQLKMCTSFHRTMASSAKNMGSYLFGLKDTDKATFLAENIEDYFRGGINNIAFEVANKWSKIIKQLNFTINNKKAFWKNRSLDTTNISPKKIASRIHMSLKIFSKTTSGLNFLSPFEDCEDIKKMSTNIITLDGKNSMDMFGYSIDINQNNMEIAISSLYSRSDKFYGNVDIYQIVKNNLVWKDSINTPFHTGLSESRFGHIVKYISNNKKPSDLLISAPSYSEPRKPNAGRIYIYKNNNHVDVPTIIKPPKFLYKYDGYIGFGKVVEIADINNDGQNDIIVGMPNYSNNDTMQSGMICAYLYNLYDTPYWCLQSKQNQNYEWFGNKIKIIKQNNQSKMLVSSPGYSIDKKASVGALYVIPLINGYPSEKQFKSFDITNIKNLNSTHPVLLHGNIENMQFSKNFVIDDLKLIFSVTNSNNVGWQAGEVYELDLNKLILKSIKAGHEKGALLGSELSISKSNLFIGQPSANNNNGIVHTINNLNKKRCFKDFESNNKARFGHSIKNFNYKENNISKFITLFSMPHASTNNKRLNGRVRIVFH